MSQDNIPPTVDIPSSVIAPSHAVDVDVPVERPSQPHFVAGDTHKFLPLHVNVQTAPLPPVSSCGDIQAQHKRLYAAAHAPLAPPTTPVVDLLCQERSILSSSSDSDYPSASQRENRPPLLGTRLRNPSGSSDISTAASADALKQSLQLTTQLAATVQQQLECTQNEASQREQRIFNDIAEREHRLLADAAERDRRTRDENSNREHALMKDAASVREALLAHDQHAREIEAERERRLLDDVQQRERDLRRDMYDLAAQRSRASALEAELNCLKANVSLSTVAPVQSADTAPPEINTAMQMSPTRPVTSIMNTADALTLDSDATDTSAEHGGRAAGILTLRPPCLFTEIDTPTAQYMQPQWSDLGSTHHQRRRLPHLPAAVVSDPAHVFPRFLPEPVSTHL